MNIPKLSNIDVEDLRRFLNHQGLNLIKDSRGRGGHENHPINQETINLAQLA